MKPAPSPGSFDGVNGAAAKRPRKAAPSGFNSHRPAASMGPRPNGRGKPARTTCFARTAPASMGPRPNGRGKAALKASSLRASRVNGAAAKRPRKVEAGRALIGKSLRQWGRGQTAAESTCPLFGANYPPASMGPRPNGRGKAAKILSVGWTHGVNGAAAKRPRKVAHHAAGRTVPPASMGPRPNGRGKCVVETPMKKLFLRQWGRGQTAAESCRLPRWRRGRPGVNGAAAKRPRKAASSKEAYAPRSSRQWGRGQTAAESRYLGKAASPRYGRQWGRGQTAAERVLRASQKARRAGVNGAAAKRPRKAFVAIWQGRRSMRQWGRGQTAAESCAGAIPPPPPRCVNGAAAKRPRKVAQDGSAVRDAVGRQWGRGQTAAESNVAFHLVCLFQRQWGRGQTAAERSG